MTVPPTPEQIIADQLGPLFPNRPGVPETHAGAILAALAAAGLHVVAEGHAVRDGRVWALEHDANRHHYDHPQSAPRSPFTTLTDIEVDPFLVATTIVPLFRLVEEPGT